MNASLPRWFQVSLGVAEVLAAVGLTLPGLTRVMPWLVYLGGRRGHDRDRFGDGLPPVRGEMSSAAYAAAPGTRDVRRLYAASVLPIGPRQHA